MIVVSVVVSSKIFPSEMKYKVARKEKTQVKNKYLRFVLKYLSKCT